MVDWGTAAIAAASAAIGGAATWYFGFVRSKEAWRQQLGDRFEEVIYLLYDLDEWVDANTEDFAFEISGGTTGVSPLARIRAICAVYFPEFLDDVTKLEISILRYISKACDALDKKQQGGTEIEVLNVMSRAAGKYSSCRIDLLKALQEYARSHLAAREPSLSRALGLPRKPRRSIGKDADP